MIDWTQIVGFEWDTGNARKSVEKHGVGQFEAEQVFFNALGGTDSARLLHITLTLRSEDTLIRVISARDMHRKERLTYEQNQKDT